MGACQCTAYVADRIYQLTQQNIRNLCPGSYNGYEWSARLGDCGYPVYRSVSDAINNCGTLAGLLMCVGPEPSCFGGSCNHIAVCEGYDQSLDQVYVSEMYGLYMDCAVRLNVYSTPELGYVRWIDISSLGFSSSGGGRGGYFKDKFGEFHWPVTPEKDARFPTSSEYQEFCDRLNEAQEEAGVENPTEFSAKQDNNVLTAARFNEYLHLMQESTEGNLRGVDDEVELMEDVQREDIIYAKHFLQLENLYNHWMYGRLQYGDDVPMAGSYSERVWDYLRSLGFSEAATAGILGNMMAECGGQTLDLDPFIIGYTPGFSYGLCQWTANFGIGNYNGEDIWYASFEDQLRFLNNTMESTMIYWCGANAYTNFKKSTSPQQAAYDFQWCYERGYGDSQRQQNAVVAYNTYKGRPLWTPGTGGGGGATGNFILPLDSYQGCICRPSEYYYGASDFKVSSWTPIKAVDGGTVTQAYYHYSYGNFVDIDHGNGWTSRYAHMVQTPSVSTGQGVSQGQVIGYVGSTGDSTGPHLHLEMRYNGQVICAGQVFGIYCPFSESYG